MLGLLAPRWWLKEKRLALALTGRPARPSRASVLGWHCVFWRAVGDGFLELLGCRAINAANSRQRWPVHRP